MKKLAAVFCFSFCSIVINNSVHADRLQHFRSWLRDPLGVGTPFRTGECTSKSFAKPLEQLQQEKDEVVMLELGANDGAQTIPFARKLREKDILVAVEKDKACACSLKEKCEQDYSNVFVYDEDFFQWVSPFEKYDYIASTIPFNSVPAYLVENILDRCHELLKEDGTFSYVEYFGWGTLETIFLGLGQYVSQRASEKLENFRAVQEALKKFKEKYDVTRETWIINAVVDCRFICKFYRNFEFWHPISSFIDSYDFEHPIHVYTCKKKQEVVETDKTSNE